MPPQDDEILYGTITRREQLTPSLVRLVLGGPGLAGWDWSGATDSYLVLHFPPADASYAAPFSVAQVNAEQPPELRPAHRHYTVRAWDPAAGEAGELTIDFVVHGDAGIAGPWAARASVGDRVVLTRPGGGYRPDPDADWHLMVGDESALPAIAAALEQVPAGRTAVAVLLCDGADHHLDLACPGDLEVVWLHRTGSPTDAELLVDAVRDLEFPPGAPQVFVHGEAGEVREVRRHLLGERGISRDGLSISGYWRRTMTDESWRRIKREWNASVETDVPA